MHNRQLLAFRASRRVIGLACFSGLLLECTFVRELSAEGRAAEQSTRAFVRWALETFPADAVVIEEPVTRPGTRAQELAGVIHREAAAVAEAVTTRKARTLLAEGDRPSRQPRQELRSLAQDLWPQLRAGSPVALDAAMVGLYEQATHLFTTNP